MHSSTPKRRQTKKTAVLDNVIQFPRAEHSIDLNRFLSEGLQDPLIFGGNGVYKIMDGQTVVWEIRRAS